MLTGKLFVRLGESNNITGQGKVEGEVSPGFFMCRFAGKVSASAIVPAADMASYVFFDSEEHMTAWLQAYANKPPAQPDPAPPAKRMTKHELVRACKDAGLEVPKRATKAQLEELLANHNSE